MKPIIGIHENIRMYVGKRINDVEQSCKEHSMVTVKLVATGSSNIEL